MSLVLAKSIEVTPNVYQRFQLWSTDEILIPRGLFTTNKDQLYQTDVSLNININVTRLPRKHTTLSISHKFELQSTRRRSTLSRKVGQYTTLLTHNIGKHSSWDLLFRVQITGTKYSVSF